MTVKEFQGSTCDLLIQCFKAHPARARFDKGVTKGTLAFVQNAKRVITSTQPIRHVIANFPVCITVQLIRSQAVQASDQCRAIPRRPMRMRKGWNVGSKGIAVGPDGLSAGISPGQQGHAGRQANRRGCVGIAETDAAGGKPVKIGRSHNRLAGAAKHMCGMLIGEDVEYVWSFLHDLSSETTLDGCRIERGPQVKNQPPAITGW
jgi:hypothetical protein